MIPFASTVLALAFVVAGALSGIAMYPPNAPPVTGFKKDRILWLTGFLPKLGTNVTVVVFLYHALVALFFPGGGDTLSTVCPHADHLNAQFFTWSLRTGTSLLLVFVGGIIRIIAYGGLGPNFTFELAAPDRLVTGGIYRFVQHPSYTGLGLVIMGALSLCYRRETAVVACSMPDAIFYGLQELSGLAPLVGGVVAFSLFAIRVRDEEMMLKERFGKEWERWHRRTARFVPWIL
ncbi:hypothetical protein FE257_003636 [Aspergillus nanangensis]|uniref:Protein-S-isoprenylcysteine O-methyltransferase n=1 Tax=Aspergillus nanangensis TaxID=2582783 RepID=A0AAD4GWF3_ASPNN|nr:hypothetical protein FE257_003636 [Aspergillus nanangensis]